ncbi:hypothetical protein ANACOL_00548 [Anaerotruncus colihominis DSM 17241]|uniref:Uncharacterized protein n=1 Tax=Anaerotruncus colihominis DSM 17241 TaxID=445972 RepID=B0P719_9FIRM|nr:hypothetical protein ANACOL_00548 [Anaerotruncus colihominis DSM 17241]
MLSLIEIAPLTTPIGRLLLSRQISNICARSSRAFCMEAI